jgi:DNA-binding MarR family transcriptional regulator
MKPPTKIERRTVADAEGTDLPLSTLLSQVLVAYTIEFDNEFEHQMPHRTTTSKPAADARGGPWLVSLVMWANFMQFVGEEGLTIGELQRRARVVKLSLAGMERWGYVVVAPDPADGRPKPPRRDWVVPTAKGRRAREVWRPLFDVIEERWQTRFGKNEIDGLRESLSAVVGQFDIELPEYLPVLGYGMIAEVPPHGYVPAVRDRRVPPRLHLPTLLSQVLLAFTIEFERESDLSLAISANVIRILSEKGVYARDLPRLAGVSKEAIKMSVGFLEKWRYLTVEPDPTAKGTKLVRLTPKGRQIQDAYRRRLGVIEERWQAQFGKDNIRRLRQSLERLVGEPTAKLSPLFRGLEPHPSGWRASVRKPDTLPHHPMVLHRGGYPDGS